MSTRTVFFPLLLCVGFSSGLPLGLSTTALQAWYTVADVDIVSIGLLGLVGQAYVFKFLWAPLFDWLSLPWLGRRRGWIFLFQVMLVILLMGMGRLSPEAHPLGLALLALALAVMSASQDIVIDAYRTEYLTEQNRGTGLAIHVAGYRLAMLVSGGLALVLADSIGFGQTYSLMALLFIPCLLMTWIAPEKPPVYTSPPLKEAFTAPLLQFFKQDKAIVVLLFIVFYKMGDALAMALSTPFLLRELHFSLAEVGWVIKTIGIGASLLGVFLGGYLLPRLGLYRALWSFGVVQAISLLAFYVLTQVPPHIAGMITAVFLEQFGSGLGTAAFLAYIMQLCQERYTATHFALLTAAAAFGRTFFASTSGWLVQWMDWSGFFIFAFLAAFPALWLLTFLKPTFTSERATAPRTL